MALTRARLVSWRPVLFLSLAINQLLTLFSVPGKSARTMPALRTWELRYTLRVQTLAAEPRSRNCSDVLPDKLRKRPEPVLHESCRLLATFHGSLRRRRPDAICAPIAFWPLKVLRPAN